MTQKLFHQITSSFFLILGLSTLVLAFYFLRSLFLLLFLAFIMASAMNPLVSKLHKWKIPRPISIFAIYAVLLSVISVLLSVIVPPLVNQTTQMINSFSRFLGVYDLHWNGFANLDLPALLVSIDQYVSQYETFFGQIQNSVSTILEIIFSTFSAVFVFFTLLISTFYILLNLDQLALSFAWMLPGNDQEQAKQARRLFYNIQHQLGSWVSGQLTLMIVIGVITFIGLTLLGIPYALPLAILAGLLEIVPNVGPTIAAIPPILIALLVMNPLMALAVTAFYIMVQQFENNLIVPFIMKEVVDVRPLTTLVLILVGFKLMGVVGALLAIPVYLTIRTISRELWPNKGPFKRFS